MTIRVVTLVCSHTLPNLFCLRCHVRSVVSPLHWFSLSVASCLYQCDGESQAVILSRSLPNHHYSSIYRRFCLHYSPLTPQSIRPYVFPLGPLESAHSNPLDSLQSSNSPPLTRREGTASVFCDK